MLHKLLYIILKEEKKMEITGLDKIKKKDNNDSEEIRVTGLDFNKKKEVPIVEMPDFGFIRKLSNDISDSEDHGVTGLEFVRKKNTFSDGDSNVTGLDFISREGENVGTASPEGLENIRQLEFSDIGITVHHDD